MKRFHGFSIIEILTVIAIIFVLAGIGIPAYNSWRNRGKIAKAKAVISKLEMAVEMYKTDFGEYPDSLSKLKDAEASNKGPYIDSKDYKGGKFKDPWDSEYEYNKSNESVTILSYGPNKNKGDKDDISNKDPW